MYNMYTLSVQLILNKQKNYIPNCFHLLPLFTKFSIYLPHHSDITQKINYTLINLFRIIFSRKLIHPSIFLPLSLNSNRRWVISSFKAYKRLIILEIIEQATPELLINRINWVGRISFDSSARRWIRRYLCRCAVKLAALFGVTRRINTYKGYSSCRWSTTIVTV